MPNTPRERLLGNNEMTARAAARMYIMLTDRNAQPDPSALLAVQIMRRLLAELDQAGQEGSEPKLESRADLRPSGGREQDVSGDPAGEKEGLAATVPQPPASAPASVEGEVESIMQPVFTASATSGSASYQYRHMVAVPDSWPIGTKVRITRVSE